MLKYYDFVYDVLKLIMDINYREYDRKLTVIFEMEVEEYRRKMEEYSKKEMKIFSKMYKDKNELVRQGCVYGVFFGGKVKFCQVEIMN